MDADLNGYFDSIPHPLLKQRIEERISDGPVRTAGRLVVTGHRQRTGTWGANGRQPSHKDFLRSPRAVISPLLAILYQHLLVEGVAKLGYRMVRYADDFVILCHSAEQAQMLLDEVNVRVNVIVTAHFTHA